MAGVNGFENGMKPRMVWVDVAKGGAIALVVLGHALRGLYAKGLVPEDFFRSIDGAIYAFHMPLFFMISGFFFFGWAGRAALTEQIGRVTQRLLVPLILWTYTFLLLRWCFADFTNARPDISSVMVLPLPGILHFWFLWALWVIQIAFLCLIALFPAGLGQRWLAYAALVVCFVLWACAPVLPFQYYLGPAYGYAIFFAIGAVLYPGLDRLPTGWGVLLGGGVFFAGLMALMQGMTLTYFSAGLLACGLSISFLVCVRGLPDRIPGGMFLLQRVGAFSFAIYMMHTIFSAGMREILLLLGVTSLSLHLCLGVLAGLVFPICASVIVSRFRFAVLLGLKA